MWLLMIALTDGMVTCQHRQSHGICRRRHIYVLCIAWCAGKPAYVNLAGVLCTALANWALLRHQAHCQGRLHACLLAILLIDID
jgi:hypothetical protein